MNLFSKRAPAVSITMAAYNHEKYVSEAIQSVLNQTYTDFEFIIVDDGSTDGTAERIRSFSDPRIKTKFLNQNGGVIGARLEALSLAKGRYIGILNSDDVFHPEKLARQVAFLDEHPTVGAVLSDAEIIDDDGLPFTDRNHCYYSIFTQPNRSRFEWLRRFFYEGNCLCIPSVLMRRKCYNVTGLPDRRFTQISDLDLWIRLCMHYEIHVFQEKLIKFRIRANNANISVPGPESTRRSLWESVKVLDRYLNITEERDLFCIFPEIAHMLDPNRPLSHPEVCYWIARLAMERGSRHHMVFAINTLYSLLGNEDTARKIKARFGFSYKDFIQLTGRFDV